MTDQSKTLYRTNYFQRRWTWIRRMFVMFFLGAGTFFIPLEQHFQFARFIIIGAIVFYYIAKPKDDLALTDKLLLHIKQSLIPTFTRIYKYEISELISIRCGGIHSDGWELVEVFGSGNSGGYYNTIEMTFKNGESKSLQLPIDRKKLDTIVKLIYDLKRSTQA